MTPIGYKDAAALLGVPEVRIRNAVSRGILTQEPNKRSSKRVYQEQVELFKGKPQLSVYALVPDERATWEAIKQRVENTTSIAPVADMPIATVIEQVAYKAAKQGARDALAHASRMFKFLSEPESEQDETSPFPVAPPDENKSPILSDSDTGGAGMSLSELTGVSMKDAMWGLLIIGLLIYGVPKLVDTESEQDELESLESIQAFLEQIEPFISREQLLEHLRDKDELNEMIRRLKLALEKAA